MHSAIITVANPWILFCRNVQLYDGTQKKTIPSLVTQGMLGNSLVKVKKRIRGRQSSVSLALMAFKKQRIQGTPTPDIRKDRIDHFPEWEKTRQQCIYCDSLS